VGLGWSHTLPPWVRYAMVGFGLANVGSALAAPTDWILPGITIGGFYCCLANNRTYCPYPSFSRSAAGMKRNDALLMQ